MLTRSTNRPAFARWQLRQRKGIILLMVVSLLALFLLMGITYALVASNYEQTAQTAARIGAQGDLAQDVTDQALNIVLNGPASTEITPLSGHSLLEDLYGNDGVTGRVFGATAEVVASSGPPIWKIVVTQNTLTRSPPSASNNGNFRWNLDNYFSGRVLTFLRADFGYPACRILAHNATNTAGGAGVTVHTLFVTAPAGYTPQQNDMFLINGAPFNGTGAGYQPIYDSTDGTQVNAVNYGSNKLTDAHGNPVALLPNYAGYLQGVRSVMRQQFLDPGHSGFDEDYDAPDFQNMALAWVPPVRNSTYDVIPSFHRAELVNYWVNICQGIIDDPTYNVIIDPTTANGANKRAQLMLQPLTINPSTGLYVVPTDDNGTAIPAPLRQRLYQIMHGCIFRPLHSDHGNFTGSNQAFASSGWFVTLQALGYQPQPAHQPMGYNTPGGNLGPVAPAYDIDNDNDGINEAIWVDVGLPVMTNAMGKRYKRLVAYTIKDLDGRINLNAHGNFSQLASVGGTGVPLPTQVGIAPALSTVSRGQGFGPADVDFSFMFGGGQYATLLSMRYGADGQAGQAGVRDAWSTIRHYGIPNDYYGSFSTSPNYGNPSTYGSVPDVYGRGVVALDAAGHPLYANSGRNNEMLDTPYEITPRSSLDAPYNLSDLEVILRRNDADISSVPSRLRTVFAGLPTSVTDNFTVHSAHMPVSVFSSPRGMRADQNLSLASQYQFDNSKTVLTGGNSIMELYYAKVAPNIYNNASITDKEQGIRNVMAAIVPWEIKRGQLFDINRPFGNGADDNNDGVVDDPSEAYAGENSPSQAPFNTFMSQNGDITFDLDNDGSISNNELRYARSMARQIYARHLFCLLLVLSDNGYNPVTVEDVRLTPDQQRELTVRRLAQYAINVVDARDSDSVMTAFEYDVNPFNGWSVDGNVASNENGATYNERRVVWGLEAPDLIITETMAFHNKRIKDTVYDSTSKDRDRERDDDLDQFAQPQGSVFLEIQNVRDSQINTAYVPNGTAQNPGALGLPREMYFYDNNAGKWRLNIGYTHPTASSDGVRHPVFQIAISADTPSNASQHSNRPYQRRISSAQPESSSFQPEDMNMLSTNFWPNGNAPAPMNIERYVWFSNVAPPAGYWADRVFLNSQGWDVSMEPGQYAVIGPRTQTYVGSLDDGMASTLWDGNSSQGIALNSFNRANLTQTGMTYSDSNGTVNGGYVTGTNIRSTVGIVADMPAPTTWTNPNRRIGLNISEPLPNSGNYYQEPNPSNDGRQPVDAYTDPANPVQGELPDAPFDYLPGRPLTDLGMQRTGLYRDRRALFLQRLADPSQPWDANTNPYITVDWSTIDLRVFSGDENIGRTVRNNGNTADIAIDPSDDPNAGPISQVFDTIERGAQYDCYSTNLRNPTQSNAGAGGLYMNYNLYNTLGYINRIVNSNNPPQGSPNVGDPTYPSPWLPFLNRPFNNPYELMMVSHSPSARLFHEISALPAPGTGRDFTRRYQTTSPGTATNVYRNYGDGTYQETHPYGHLVNFFQSSGTANNAPHWYRLFDYCEVPSQFVDAQEYLNPTLFAGLTSPSGWDAFKPPFNWINKYRDPGRININTLASDNTYYAATRSVPLLCDGAHLSALIQSRQGYNGAFQTLNPNFPSRFAGVFTSANTADLGPLQNMRQRGQGGGASVEGQGIEGTLLRRKLGNNNEPLLVTRVFDVGNAYRDTDRNSYFQYENYQKLGNILTTRSNVFAIWVTVGHFEVEDTTVSEACPDGLALGQELGADTGEINRIRSFYIIDRSIPAGFIPGRKLNSDNTILLHRRLE
ncbi:MAG: hypothetical protein ACO1RA_07000 [Planctomycetaceae bacterium]